MKFIRKKLFQLKHNDNNTQNIFTILGIKIKFRKRKNYSLNSGERQTATNIKDIRKDHVNRYKLAVEIIKKYIENTSGKLKGLDIFCGNGYGSYYVEKNINTELDSIDGSNEAIICAKKYYNNKNIKYTHKLFPFKLKKNMYDFIISLESIEHIKDDKLFIKELYSALKQEGILIISTPNQEKQDLQLNPNIFHFRHYRNNEFINLMKNMGFKCLEIYGQDTYLFDENKIVKSTLSEDKMDIKKDYNGQFSIFTMKKY